MKASLHTRSGSKWIEATGSAMFWLSWKKSVRSMLYSLKGRIGLVEQRVGTHQETSFLFTPTQEFACQHKQPVHIDSPERSCISAELWYDMVGLSSCTMIPPLLVVLLLTAFAFHSSRISFFMNTAFGCYPQVNSFSLISFLHILVLVLWILSRRSPP